MLTAEIQPRESFMEKMFKDESSGETQHTDDETELKIGGGREMGEDELVTPRIGDLTSDLAELFYTERPITTVT